MKSGWLVHITSCWADVYYHMPIDVQLNLSCKTSQDTHACKICFRKLRACSFLPKKMHSRLWGWLVKAYLIWFFGFLGAAYVILFICLQHCIVINQWFLFLHFTLSSYQILVCLTSHTATQHNLKTVHPQSLWLILLLPLKWKTCRYLGLPHFKNKHNFNEESSLPGPRNRKQLRCIQLFGFS